MSRRELLELNRMQFNQADSENLTSVTAILYTRMPLKSHHIFRWDIRSMNKRYVLYYCFARQRMCGDVRTSKLALKRMSGELPENSSKSLK